MRPKLANQLLLSLRQSAHASARLVIVMTVRHAAKVESVHMATLAAQMAAAISLLTIKRMKEVAWVP